MIGIWGLLFLFSSFRIAHFLPSSLRTVAHQRMKTPKRILVIRLSAIGDIVMASGLIPAMRKRWPTAHITWLVEEPMAGLLSANPKVDEVQTLPRGRWRHLRQKGNFGPLLQELNAMRHWIQDQNFDLVLDLQGLLKSGIWAFLSHAEKRIGLGSKEGSQWLMTETLPRLMEDPRIGKEYRDLCRYIGADPEDFSLEIVISDSDRASARLAMQENGIEGAYGVLAPLTTRAQKHWPDEHWGQLAERISSLGPLVILGGPADLERAQQIVALSKRPLVNLVGQLPLMQSAAVVESARFLVGVDTGLTHLGIALKTPTAAIFGSTAPYLNPLRDDAQVLYEPRNCSPCHRHPSCNDRFDCMRTQTPERVAQTLMRLAH